MKAVLTLPSFRRLVLAYALNEFAWSVGNFALSLLVYRRTGNALASTGFFLTSQFLPAFITPSVVAWADRFDPRRVLAVLYALQACLFLTLAAAPSHFYLAPILALVLVGGSLGLAARPILRATTARLVTPGGFLRDSNAVINVAFGFSILLGPIIGSALVLASGTTLAVLVDAAIFGTISLALAAAHGLSATLPERRGPRLRVRAALEQANRHVAVRRILTFQAVAWTIFSMTLPLEVVLAQHVLHAGAAGYGALLSAWGSGAIVGSALYARWRALPGWLLIAFGSSAIGVGFLLMAVAPSIVLAVVGAVIGGVGNGIEPVAERTALQEQVEDGWMTLTLSLNESIFQAFPGPGFLLGGLLATLTGARLAFLVAGVGAVSVALLAPLLLRTPSVVSGTDEAGDDRSAQRREVIS
ncbi:MFS transporter [Conexibacter sp. DBS9H8]|uniref:MFS transporter n=1 Tax=Conexibacter sp. DBS9H8 TaxID=2937801 RepID=UPI00200ED5AD|nr:MFS transporter [Conexibacter sp. DBS9H8]